MKNIDVTVVMPAYNEEKNLKTAVEAVQTALHNRVRSYEIIIVNDASHDTTGAIAEKLRNKDKRIRVYHNIMNRGFGFSMQFGIRVARKTFLTWFPSDNEIVGSLVSDLVESAQSTGITTSYSKNTYDRPIHRRFLSWLFVTILNTFFGLNEKYYTGPFICRTRSLKNLPLKSHSNALTAEIIIRLLTSGRSSRVIPFEYRQRIYGKSTALSWKSISQTLFTLIILGKEYILRSRVNMKNILH